MKAIWANLAQVAQFLGMNPQNSAHAKMKMSQMRKYRGLRAKTAGVLSGFGPRQVPSPLPFLL